MKKTLFAVLAIFMLFSSVVFSQEITKKALGVFFQSSFDQDGKVVHDGLAYVKGEVTQSISPYQTLIARGSWSSNGKYLTQFWADTKFGEASCLSVGYFGRTIAQLNRPSPISNASVFEAPGTAKIPGSAINAMFVQGIGISKLYSSASYVQADKCMEYSLGMHMKTSASSPDYKIAGIYSSKRWGVAGTFKSDNITMTGYYDSEKIMSGFCEVSTESFGDPYFSISYDRLLKTNMDCEIGWTKTVDIKNIPGVKTLIGFGYETVQKVANLYLWVYF